MGPWLSPHQTPLIFAVQYISEREREACFVLEGGEYITTLFWKSQKNLVFYQVKTQHIFGAGRKNPKREKNIG